MRVGGVPTISQEPDFSSSLIVKNDIFLVVWQVFLVGLSLSCQPPNNDTETIINYESSALA